MAEVRGKQTLFNDILASSIDRVRENRETEHQRRLSNLSESDRWRVRQSNYCITVMLKANPGQREILGLNSERHTEKVIKLIKVICLSYHFEA